MPLFFVLFLPTDACGVHPVAGMVNTQCVPGRAAVEGVTEVIAKGFGALPTSAIVSMVVAAISAAAIEVE